MQTEQWLSFVNKYMQVYYQSINKIRHTKQPFPNINSNVLSLPKIEFNHTIQVIVYFFKKGIRFPVEVWSFSLNKNNHSHKKAINTVRLNKKLFILNRSICSLLKLLPLYQLIKSGFGFHFETEIVSVYSPHQPSSTMNAINDTTNSYKRRIRSNKTGKVVLNVNSESCASLRMEVQYLTTNSTVFVIEEQVKQEMLEEKVEQQKKRIIAQSGICTQGGSNDSDNEYDIESSTENDDDNDEHIDENEFNMSRLNNMSFTVKLGKRNDKEERGSLVDDMFMKGTKEVNLHEKQEMQNIMNKVHHMNETFYCKSKCDCVFTNNEVSDDDDECLLSIDNGFYDDESDDTCNMILELGGSDDNRNDDYVNVHDENQITNNINEHKQLSSPLSSFQMALSRYQQIKHSQYHSLNGALNLIKLSKYIKS